MNRSSLNRRFLAWGGLSAALVAAGVGCSQNSALVRGQSPEVGVARAGDAASPVFRGQSPDRPRPASPFQRPKPSHNTKLVSHEGTTVGPEVFSQGAVMGGEYPQGYCPPQGAYPPGYCPPGHGAPGVPCPVGLSGHTYTYRDPGMPVYPPGTGPAMTGPGSPGAVVQYPYYTTKGPDDFFLDQDGRY